MMDLELDSFDVISWVNKSITHGDCDSLLKQLRGEWASSHSDLSGALSEALGAVPWCVREADRVRKRGGVLREGVDGVSERVEGVETGAEEAVATIASADAVLRRVERAKDMLTRAAEIDVLADRIEVSNLGSQRRLPSIVHRHVYWKTHEMDPRSTFPPDRGILSTHHPTLLTI